MRIAYIISGTGGSFYCENCIRDCALISGLQTLGHEVTAVPMYLPLMQEEHVSLSDAPIFFGAVRLYLEDRFPFLKSLPTQLLKIFDAPPMLAFAASKAGSTRASGHEQMTIHMLQGTRGPFAREFDRLVSWILKEVKPDAVFLSNIFLLGVAQALKARSRIPIASLVQDEHTWIESCADQSQSTIWDTLFQQSSYADFLFSVSTWYAAYMEKNMSLPHGRIISIPFGLDPSRYFCAEIHEQPLHIGYLNRISESGGLVNLTEACSLIRTRGMINTFHLSLCGGYTKDDLPCIKSCLRPFKKMGTVKMYPTFGHSTRTDFLSSLSVLTVPVPGDIAFGTFIIEALASGVPVVQPDQGGFSEIVHDTGGGILYSPNTPGALADALESLLMDKNKRKKLAQAGYDAVAERYTHIHMAKAVINSLEGGVVSP